MHLTDSESFPLVLKSRPEFGQIAFSPRERYTLNELKDLAAFAAQRNVRLVVEIDVPAAGADAGDGTGIVRVRWDHGHVDVYCDGARGLHDVARRVPPAVCTEAAPAVRVEDSEPSE